MMYGGDRMLRPDDIRSTAFKKGLFGYKAADVDSFKDTVPKIMRKQRTNLINSQRQWKIPD